jgi:hypothetical protein
MLAEAIRNLKARRVVLVVDACQSGGAVESLAKIGEVKLAIEQRRADHEKASGRPDHTHDVGVYIMAAATPVQEALEPLPGAAADNRKDGLLTTALLKALNETDPTSHDDKLWMSTIFERVKRTLPDLAKQFHSVQTAFPVQVGSDFPIAK